MRNAFQESCPVKNLGTKLLIRHLQRQMEVQRWFVIYWLTIVANWKTFFLYFARSSIDQMEISFFFWPDPDVERCVFFSYFVNCAD